MLFHEVGQIFFQPMRIAATSLDNLAGFFILRHAPEHVLETHELVMMLDGVLYGLIDELFDFGRELHGLRLFYSALQWIMVLLRVGVALVRLRFGDFIGIDSCNSRSFVMDLEHDLGRLLFRLLKEALENVDHKIAGRKIIIEHDDFVELWRFSSVGRLNGDIALMQRLARIVLALGITQAWEQTGIIRHAFSLGFEGGLVKEPSSGGQLYNMISEH